MRGARFSAGVVRLRAEELLEHAEIVQIDDAVAVEVLIDAVAGRLFRRAQQTGSEQGEIGAS